jgi:SSS family transporter
MNTLIAFVVVYLLCTIAIGLYAASRVKNTADFAVAGRSLPLIMVITTTFATWFGSETVLGVPAKFIEGGLTKTVEDPFGAAMCLILVGMFFANKLYKLKLITIGSFYRERYGKGVEIFSSAVIMISYLGWVAAQVTALGLVFNVLSDGGITRVQGMAIGTLVVLSYTAFGGMWSVAITDFVQIIVVIVGLSLIAYFAADLAGGADQVFAYAAQKDLFNFFPEPTLHAWLFWIGAAMTLMIGSIPQQDVFQRVMSANSEGAARKGAVIGGVCYILFAFVPMFIVASALLVMPEKASELLKDDPQKVMPTLVMEQMPFAMQVLFFGALLSAIKSTASATLLAPSVTFTENIWRQFRPHTSDHQQLRTMRITVLVFSLFVLAYAIYMQGTSIYEMVSGAYQVTLVGAFIPLVFGLYWKRATTQGAVFAIVLGLVTWLLFLATPAGEVFPAQLAGLIAALVGMILGSVGPQAIRNSHASHHRLAGS